MSTLDTNGMLTRFRVNRPLNSHEAELRLSVKRKASDRPHYELSLVKLNSTFAECVDKWYSMRGFVAMGGAAIGFVFGVAFLFGLTDLFAMESFEFLYALLVVWAMALAAAGIFIFSRDAFTFTHYPIRFNRRNRQVYVFRRNGTVLKAAWDEICWTIYGHGVGNHDGYVMGHVMHEDRKTIKESFALSKVTTVDEAGVAELKGHFEFFRRYVEDGPGPVLEAIKPTPLIMLPAIDQARESWAFGWERITLNANGWPLVQIVLQVLILPMSLFRWLVMHTSRIPRWPQWVEDECVIEPGDPWVRDGRHRA